MIEYNTSMPQIKMREYGRNIQRLIDFCMQIEDREERTRCANAIADIMVHLFPDLKEEDTRQKVWDHINMISNFKLDVDFPFPVLGENDMRPSPEKIPYSVKSGRFRVYGSNLVRMVKEIAAMEGGLEKDKIIFLVANQMKKLLINVNAEGVTDRRVFNDIKEISGGRIDIDPENYKLNEYIGVNNNSDNKKKKKK